MKLTELYEDYHGGSASSAGNFPNRALERSQTVKGPLDRFNKKKKDKQKDGR